MDADRARTSLSFPVGLAWSACALALALIARTFVLAILLDRPSDVYEYLFSLVLVSYALVGGVVASRLPGNPVGWYFLSIAVSLALSGPTLPYASYGLFTDPCPRLERWRGY